MAGNTSLMRAQNLHPNPTPFCTTLSAVITSLDTTAPRRAGFADPISPSVQPSSVPLALQRVHRWLLDRIYMIGHSYQREVPVRQLITNAASFVPAVI